jgi:hypothetical protein
MEDNDIEHVSVVGFPRRLWRRSRPTNGSEPDVVPTTPERSTEGGEVDVTVAARHDPTRNQPVLTSLLTTRGRRPRWFVIVIAALLTGGLAGAVTAWIAAPIIAGAVIIGCLVPWIRLLFVLAPVGLLAATGYYMVYEQLKYRYVSAIGWPASFPAANTLTWMAVVALLAAAVVEVARWRPWSLEPDPVKAPEPSPLPLPLLPELPPMAARRVEASTDSEGDPGSPAQSATPGSDGAPLGESDTAPDEAPTDEAGEATEYQPAIEPGDATMDETKTTEREATEPETEPETTEPVPIAETQSSTGDGDGDGDGDDTPTTAEADEPPIAD